MAAQYAGLLRRTAGGAAMAAALALSSAGAQTWTATLTGASEFPPNTSPGTGQALITLSGTNLTINVTFQDLLFPTIASHIHCCTAVPGVATAGVATAVPTFPGFPLGVTSGTYNNTFDLLVASTYNPAFLTASGGDVNVAMARLIAGMNAGTAYLNIHSTQFTGGEIRGFIVATPEPASMLLVGSGLAGIAAVRRRRRQPLA